MPDEIKPPAVGQANGSYNKSLHNIFLLLHREREWEVTRKEECKVLRFEGILLKIIKFLMQLAVKGKTWYPQPYCRSYSLTMLIRHILARPKFLVLKVHLFKSYQEFR